MCHTTNSGLLIALNLAGGAWLTAVAGSFGVQMMYNTPMTLKVFQTRIYAQAFTLAALCGAAAITITDEDNEKVLYRNLANDRRSSGLLKVSVMLVLERPDEFGRVLCRTQMIFSRDN